ncbi:hypothetical protein QAD02_020105 [Eretmocerus hayati]|uniref:Uncharacterized protein n=1 Tax=Eretmocerus hayati TaxID=131215 RepID=A0ACC2PMP8_9HYME|nr:hypothetical protein QAD02_020105 [Eretmocerus hayati]
MRIVLICGLLTLLIGDILGCQVRNGVTKKFKTGYVDIETKNSRVILTVRKYDGTSFKDIMFTRQSDALLSQELSIEPDCSGDTKTTCIMLRKSNVTVAKIWIDPDQEVVRVSRTVSDANSTNPSAEIADCFEFADDTEWFGGPQMRYQHWPVHNMYFEEEPYVTSHPTNMAIVERYWLNSRGIYIFANDEDPLFLDQNNRFERHLCLIARNRSPYRYREQVTLTYEIGAFADSRAAHENAVKQHLGKPSGIPDQRMIAKPVWSTWARYKVHVNETVVLDFADEILSKGFSNSQLEIDDNWETCYGSAKFDTTKFPDITSLTQRLKKKGFRVTLWIHPFINEGCNDGYSYDTALKKGYFVKNEKGEVHTTWWQGKNGAAAIDFTNKEAVEWWVARLNELRKLGIDSFKFDAGETSWLPQTPDITGPKELQPLIYTHNYTTNLGKYFDDVIEARVGWRTQSLPYFVRMIDKDTRWTMNNGLPTLITTLIQMNLSGYVLVLPDMIGGNGYVSGVYGEFDTSMLPPKEMFIRWLQANVFMPSIQYSFVPWDFDDETIEICKNFTQLHEQISPKIIEIMKKAVETGAPVNPPIWWVDPSNSQAHQINDEFLLGEQILVAPVIEEGAVTRNIYLPAGKWQDPTTDKVYVGPKWLTDYPAPLNVLPYFNKV